jgi:hypothetical protein
MKLTLRIAGWIYVAGAILTTITLVFVHLRTPWIYGTYWDAITNLARNDLPIILLWPVVVAVLLYIGIFHIRIE